MTASHYARKATQRNRLGLHYNEIRQQRQNICSQFQLLLSPTLRRIPLIHRRIREDGLAPLASPPPIAPAGLYASSPFASTSPSGDGRSQLSAIATVLPP